MPSSISDKRNLIWTHCLGEEGKRRPVLKYPAMKPSKIALVVGVLGFFCIAYPQTSTRVDSAFQKFWSAQSPDEAERYTDDVIKSGVTFDEALQRLKTGRTYTAAKTGIVMLQNKTKDGIEHFYALNVPANYDPARRYQMRFQLHGGVGGRTSNQPQPGSVALGLPLPFCRKSLAQRFQLSDMAGTASNRAASRRSWV